MRNLKSGIIVAIIICIIFFLGFFTDLELVSYDYRLMIKSIFQNTGQAGVVIVKIDGKSLRELQEWPWSREYHAGLIKILNQAGARRIGLDLILDIPAEDQEDKLLDKQLGMVDNVVLPYVLDIKGKRSLWGTDFTIVDRHYPLDRFKKNVNIGYINLISDRDGKIRRINILKNDSLNSFASQLVPDHLKQDWPGEYYLNFHRSDYFRDISYVKVLKGDFPDDLFKDKVVLIGATADSLRDYLMTPLSIIKGYTAGVVIHAEIVDNYLNNSFIWKLNNKLTLVFILLISLASAFVFYILKPVPGIGLLIFCIILLIITSVILIIRFNLFVPVIPLILTIILNYVACNLAWFRKSERRGKKLYSVFSRYLSPAVIREMMKLPEESYLNGKRREVTVLFIDLDGFTAYSEGKKPEKVVNILNNYLSLINNETFSLRGTLDKFLGDGALVLFNAPLGQKDHASRAVKLALKLQDEITNGVDYPLPVSIGINSGEAVVGNIGSRQRSDYTAVGDVVNTAARIEEITNPGEIIVGENTFRMVENEFNLEYWQQVKLRGKESELKLYRVNFQEGSNNR